MSSMTSFTSNIFLINVDMNEWCQTYDALESLFFSLRYSVAGIVFVRVIAAHHIFYVLIKSKLHNNCFGGMQVIK